MNTNPISMQIVKSSQIYAAGHDSATETLALQFLSKGQPGGVYHYAPVPAAMYHSMLAAESIGKFFGANIKGKEGISYQRMNFEKAEA